MTKRTVDDLGPGYQGPPRGHSTRPYTRQILVDAWKYALVVLALAVTGWAIVAFVGWTLR